LLLEVRFVDPGKRLGEDDASTQVPWLHRGVLSGTPFAIILVSNHHPVHLSRQVIAAHCRDRVLLSGEDIGGGVDLVIVRIEGPNQSVVGDIVKVTLVLEPRASSADVVGGALALHFDKNGHGLNFPAIPG